MGGKKYTNAEIEELRNQYGKLNAQVRLEEDALLQRSTFSLLKNNLIPFFLCIAGIATLLLNMDDTKSAFSFPGVIAEPIIIICLVLLKRNVFFLTDEQFKKTSIYKKRFDHLNETEAERKRVLGLLNYALQFKNMATPPVFKSKTPTHSHSGVTIPIYYTDDSSSNSSNDYSDNSVDEAELLRRKLVEEQEEDRRLEEEKDRLYRERIEEEEQMRQEEEDEDNWQYYFGTNPEYHSSENPNFKHD